MSDAEIPDLLRRVREATGPDFDLDEAIMAALFGEGEPVELIGGPPRKYRMFHFKGVGTALRLTSSVDAVLAIIADKLPEWDYHIAYNARSGMHQVSMWRGADLGHKDASPKLALSLLAAALEAMKVVAEAPQTRKAP